MAKKSFVKIIIPSWDSDSIDSDNADVLLNVAVESEVLVLIGNTQIVKVDKEAISFECSETFAAIEDSTLIFSNKE